MPLNVVLAPLNPIVKPIIDIGVAILKLVTFIVEILKICQS